MKWLTPLRDLSLLKNATAISEIFSRVDCNATPCCLWKNINKTWNALEIVDYTLTGPGLALLILVGVVSGCLCLITFYYGLRKLRLYTYLIVLATWDVFYLLTSIYLYCLPTFVYHEIVSFGPLSVLQPIIYYLGAVARVGCVWTVVIIAVERYIALCHPFKFQAWNSSQRRLCCIFAGVALCAFLYCLPRYWEVTSGLCFEVSELRNEPRITDTFMRRSTSYWLLYRVLGGLLLYSVGPFFTLVLLTVKIGVEISTSNKRYESVAPPELVAFNNESSVAADNMAASDGTSSSNGLRPSFSDHATAVDVVRMWVRGGSKSLSLKKRQSAGTLSGGASPEKRLNQWMHVAMMSKFLLCYSFPIFLDVWELVKPSVAQDARRLWNLMTHASLFLVALNSSCNFFIYFATSERFRADCAHSLTRSSKRARRFFKLRSDFT